MSINRVIIGLCGKKGTGKTAMANYLGRYGFVEYSVASPIKEIGKALGFRHKSMYGDMSEKESIDPMYGISGREFLQKFGSDIGHTELPKLLPNFSWTRILVDRIARSKAKYIVISDIRFPEEYTAVKELGGIVIRITDDGKHNDTHISESLVDTLPYDRKITNHKNTAYYDEIDQLLSSLNIEMPEFSRFDIR